MALLWSYPALQALHNEVPKAVAEGVLSQQEKDTFEDLFGVTVRGETGGYTQRFFTKVKVPSGRSGIVELSFVQQKWLGEFLQKLPKTNARITEAKRAIEEVKNTTTRPGINAAGNAFTIVAVGGLGSTALQGLNIISAWAGLGILGGAAVIGLYVAWNVYEQAEREHQEMCEREERNLKALEIRFQLACARWIKKYGDCPLPQPRAEEIEEVAELREAERNARGNALKVGGAVAGAVAGSVATALKAAGIGGAVAVFWPVAVGFVIGLIVGAAIYCLRKRQIEKQREFQARRNYLDAQLRVINEGLDFSHAPRHGNTCKI